MSITDRAITDDEYNTAKENLQAGLGITTNRLYLKNLLTQDIYDKVRENPQLKHDYAIYLLGRYSKLQPGTENGIRNRMRILSALDAVGIPIKAPIVGPPKISAVPTFTPPPPKRSKRAASAVVEEGGRTRGRITEEVSGEVRPGKPPKRTLPPRIINPEGAPEDMRLSKATYFYVEND